MVSKKIIHYLCEDGIEKSVPCGHRLSSLRNPSDAKRVILFYSFLTLIIDSYNHKMANYLISTLVRGMPLIRL